MKIRSDNQKRPGHSRSRRIALGLLLVAVAGFAGLRVMRMRLSGQPAVSGSATVQHRSFVVPPIEVSLEDAGLFDEQGTWIEVSGLRLSVSPIDLATATVQVKSVAVESLVFHRWPVRLPFEGGPDEDRDRSADNGRVSAGMAGDSKATNFGVTLARFEVQDMVVMPEASGLPDVIRAAVTGHAAREPGGSVYGSLKILVRAPENLDLIVDFKLNDDLSHAVVSLNAGFGEDRLRADAVFKQGESLHLLLNLVVGRFEMFGISVGQAEITAAVVDLLGEQLDWELDVRISDMTTGDWRFNLEGLNVSGIVHSESVVPDALAGDARVVHNQRVLDLMRSRPDALNVRLEYAGIVDALFREFPVTVNIRGDAEGAPSMAGEQRLTVAALDGGMDGVDFALEQPMQLRRDQESVVLAPVKLRVGDAGLQVGGRLAGSEIEALLAWQTPSLNWLPWVARRDVDAAMDGWITLGGLLAEPDMQMMLTLSGVRLGDDALSSVWIDRLEAGVRSHPAEGMHLSASLYGFETNLLAVQTVWPRVLQMTARPMLVDVPGMPVQGRLTASLPLGLVGDLLFPDDTRRIHGTAEAELHWAGALDELEFTGWTAIRNGSYHDLRFGTHVRDVEILVRGDRDGLVIESGTARDRHAGAMLLDGQVELFPWGNWKHDFRLRFERMQIVERDDITAFLGGDISLSGDVAESRLAGNLLFSPVEIRLPERLPAVVPVLPISDPAAPLMESGDPRSALFPRLVMDITLESPNRVFVRNRAVDTEWQGRMEIGGTLDSPLVNGEMNALHGRFMVLGRRFVLQQGSIRFPGYPVTPHFDAVAETGAGDITARLRLSGTPREARWELSSVPDLPEDEILAHIFFNRSVASPTPVQALRVAQAAEALAGGGQLTDVLEFGRRALRVDRIDYVDAETPEESPRVSVGKYIGARGFVDLEKDVAQSEGGRARFSYEIMPGISLETEVETDGERGIGLRWRFDY